MNSWSIGTLIGLPLTILGIVVCLAAAVFFWRWERREHGDGLGYIGAGLAVAGLAALLVVLIWGFWPYKAEYHQWRTTTGTVAAVDSRLVGADKSTTQRFVVEFTDGRQRACDDTRCAQVKPGDDLTLMCKRAWQYAANPGYDCNFVEVKR